MQETREPTQERVEGHLPDVGEGRSQGSFSEEQAWRAGSSHWISQKVLEKVSSRR